MRVIISPAKQKRVDTDTFTCTEVPVFLEKTGILKDWITIQKMESSGTAAAIRAEAGNRRYEYFFPMNDPETVLLIDSWEDQAAIDLHHASPMMRAMEDQQVFDRIPGGEETCFAGLMLQSAGNYGIMHDVF